MSTSTFQPGALPRAALRAEDVAAAAPMPDILPPVRARRGFLGFLRRNPTIAIGGGLMLLIILMAVLAPSCASRCTSEKRRHNWLNLTP